MKWRALLVLLIFVTLIGIFIFYSYTREPIIKNFFMDVSLPPTRWWDDRPIILRRFSSNVWQPSLIQFDKQIDGAEGLGTKVNVYSAYGEFLSADQTKKQILVKIADGNIITLIVEMTANPGIGETSEQLNAYFYHSLHPGEVLYFAFNGQPYLDLGKNTVQNVFDHEIKENVQLVQRKGIVVTPNRVYAYKPS